MRKTNNLVVLKKQIGQGESETLEFKTSTSELKKAVETLCAFLNHKGGEVLIGIKNNGQLTGQYVTDNTRQEIANELSKIEPPGQVEVKYISLADQKQIISLRASMGQQAPYVYDGRPFWRELSTTRRMSQQRYDQLVAQRTQLNYSWERFPARGYALQDLDEELIVGVIRKAVEVKRLPETALRQDLAQVLERLELLENGQLNNAAVVLFGKRFNADFLQCQLKIARFKGKNRHEFLDSDLITHNLFELLEAGLLFSRRHLPLAAKIMPDKVERVEKFLIPFDAIREALLNALCHRDYSNHTGPIGLAIYDDRMEIFNEGGLLQGISLEKIKSGFSKPRNPLIANVLYRCNMIERWGRGIQEIIQSCMTAGDPEPQFQVDTLEFKVLFRFPNAGPGLMLAEDAVVFGKQLTKRQQEIVMILTHAKPDQELKTVEIWQQLLEPPAERTLRDDLAELKRLGIIGSRGHARTTVWFLTRV